MSRPFSIRRRLLVWLLVATAVFGTLALIDTWREAVRMANALADRVLAGSALVIAERASLDEDGLIAIEIPYGALEMLSSAAEDRVFYRVDGPPGRLVTGYDDLPMARAVQGGVPVFADDTFRGEPVRVASLARAASTGIDEVPFVVTVAETTNARRELTQTILMRSALRLALMMLGAGLIVGIAVTVSLRPLHRLGEAIATRSPDDLGPVETPVPSEVRGLVGTINLFMSRLKTALDGLRNFTGNAGHQLRTPLAVVRTQLALAARAGTLAEAQEAAQKGDAAVAHAERILAQLLLLAKVDAAAGHDPQPLELSGFARDVTADSIPAAADAGIDLGFEGDAPLIIRAEPLLLAEALQNLIRNAILHAGTGAVVTVRVRGEGPDAILEVEDDGPGIPEPARPAAFGRFARGVTHGPGMGLGLPVVEEIVHLFGGALTLHAGQEGQGLCARIRFRAQPT
ncbi:sensor histidine kinase [Paracoccus laeviglucosivorans]|uniref:histidine kinase n=1 Tax=Paracoccus laeviglucosivorans TaxID=1197861 RepID=A0A521ALI6_9RHOB|nr:sensor histidine kinase [Paracoccus laeviglucosivorans]SMO35704.1 two-component system, OmpR family, sensor histidine kinase TctE [Paracoccus laeviglucosivorans]